MTGIGRVTAKALQNAGFRVFGTSRRAAAEGADGVSMLACDVTDDASVAKLVDEVASATSNTGNESVDDHLFNFAV
jgi:NAD(P)-dependent dehydrogenase (short-subunit alcohol dehydrogenase family)